MTLHLGEASYQHMVDDVLTYWADHWPRQVLQVKKAAVATLERRGNDKGHAEHGYIKGGLPDELSALMVRKFGPVLQRDPVIHRCFWRSFCVGRFNTYERRR